MHGKEVRNSLTQRLEKLNHRRKKRFGKVPRRRGLSDIK